MLNPDFRDMLSALQDAEVEYLIVGAFALAAHGMPRATGDIDVWVRPVAANAVRVLDALRQFGAPTSAITTEDLASPDVVFQIGIAPRRIDILTSIDGVKFPEAWQRRISVDIDGLEIPVLSKKDFLTNKRVVGRPKDLADVAWLESKSGD
ncbi:MAG: hypothetical protein GY822_11395 [Deltaproteobacteria bacterium]|nr:hypothetical protein [Deltaproteobacteria bacterium]